MPVQTLSCPQCDAPLDPPAERTQFFCQFCGATVVIPAELQQVSSRDEPASDDVIRPTPDLSKFTIDKFGDDLTITWSWRSWMLAFLIPFALFWNGITWTVAGAFMLGGGPDVPWFAKLIALPHICVGLGLIYAIFAIAFNKTTIRVSRDLLAINHGPLPWKTPKPIPTGQIEQLYVEEKIHRSSGGSSATYTLLALVNGGKKQKLIGGYQSADTPQAVERMIEVHLGIADQRVAGEHV